MAYDPDLSQLSEILKAYARQGAREYNNLESNIRRRIGIKFAQRVVADEKQIDDWFLDFSAGKASKPSIFPTPKPEAQIDAAFFYPRWEKGKFRLELLLWFDKEEINGKTMAFRLEPGHAKGNVHNYSHVQISRHVRAPINFTTSIPVWIPVSFPGFLTGCQTSIDHFLVAMIALHGFCRESNSQRYSLAVLKKFLTPAGLTGYAPEIASKMKALVA